MLKAKEIEVSNIFFYNDLIMDKNNLFITYKNRIEHNKIYAVKYDKNLNKLKGDLFLEASDNKYCYIPTITINESNIYIAYRDYENNNTRIIKYDKNLNRLKDVLEPNTSVHIYQTLTSDKDNIYIAYSDHENNYRTHIAKYDKNLNRLKDVLEPNINVPHKNLKIAIDKNNIYITYENNGSIHITKYDKNLNRAAHVLESYTGKFQNIVTNGTNVFIAYRDSMVGLNGVTRISKYDTNLENKFYILEQNIGNFQKIIANNDNLYVVYKDVRSDYKTRITKFNTNLIEESEVLELDENERHSGQTIVVDNNNIYMAYNCDNKSKIVKYNDIQKKQKVKW